METKMTVDSGRYARLRLVTPKMIYHTVMTDAPTYFWFTKVVFADKFKQAFVATQISAGEYLRAYGVYSVMAMLLGVLSAMGWMMIFFKGDSGILLLLAVASLAALGSFLFFIRRRECIARLASKLLEINVPPIPPGMTLYHMGEVYAREYQVPSLVEAVWSWDYMLKYAFLFSYFGAFGIYFLSFRDIMLWVFVGCVLAAAVFQLCFLWRKM